MPLNNVFIIISVWILTHFKVFEDWSLVQSKLELLLLILPITNKRRTKFCQWLYVFIGYPAILALEVMKRQILLPSLLWIFLVLRLVYPMILNVISASIFFPLGKMIRIM